MDVGDKICIARRKSGLTQEELAERIGVSRQTVSKWELNINYPAAPQLKALSDFFCVSSDWLLSPESLDEIPVKCGEKEDDSALFFDYGEQTLFARDLSLPSDIGKEAGALYNVTLNFGSRGLVFLVGKKKSGAGALIEAFAGNLKPSKGDFGYKGVSFYNFSASGALEYKNRTVGYISADAPFFGYMTAGENVRASSLIQGGNISREETENILNSFSLYPAGGTSAYGRKVKSLNRAERQYLSMAEITAKQPDIVLARDPAAFSDAETEEKIYSFLKEYSKTHLVIISSSDKYAADKYADRIIRFVDGEVSEDSFFETPLPAEAYKERPLPPLTRPSLKFFARCFLHCKRALSAFIIALSVLASACLGYAVCVASSDFNYVALKNAFSQNARVIIADCGEKNFSEGQISALSSLSDYPLSPMARCNIDIEDNYSSYDEHKAAAYEASFISQGYFVEISDESALSLIADERLSAEECRLPRDKTEVAITKSLAETFIKYGYTDGENVYEISSPKDLIGKKIGSLTVCGVYSTGENSEVLSNALFVVGGFLGGALTAAKSIAVNVTAMAEEAAKVLNGAAIEAQCKYSVAINNLYGSSPITVTVAIIGAVLLICAFFAFLLRYRFGLKRRDEFFIGASKKDYGIIFFIVSLAIFVISFAASLMVFSLYCIAFNVGFGAALLVPNAAAIAAMFVLSAAVPFSTVFLALKSVKN